MAILSDSLRSGGLIQGPLSLQPRTTGEVPFDIQGIASQTAVLLRVRNSAGTTLFSVDNNGNVTYIGDETISDSLTVTGAIVGNSTLAITGLGTFSAGINVTGATTTTTLAVSSSSTFGSNVVVSGTLTTLGLNVNGTANFFGAVDIAGATLFANGTAAAPSISFTSDTDTGLYRVAANTLGITANGASIAQFGSGRVGIAAVLPTNCVVAIGEGATDTTSAYIDIGHSNVSPATEAFMIRAAYTINTASTPANAQSALNFTIVSTTGAAYNLGTVNGFTGSATSNLNVANTTTLLRGGLISVDTQAGTTTESNALALLMITEGGTNSLGITLKVRTPTFTAGTFTAGEGIRIQNQSLATMTTAIALQIDSQSANATTTRAIRISGTGANNAISWGASALQYSSAAENIRFTDSTAANGIDFTLLATALQTINTVSTTTGSLVLQSQTFTAGASHNAVAVTPTWATENFLHIGLGITATQNGTNTNVLTGLQVSMIKGTGATTLATMNGVLVTAQSITGTVTASNAIFITDQTNANATTPRGINFATAGVANSIVWGGSAIQYANAANNIRMADSTNVAGLDFNLTTTSTSINGVATANSIIFQNLGITPGATFSAVAIQPVFGAENFAHNALAINATSAANTVSLQGLAFTLTKSAAGALSAMNFIQVSTPVISAGTITSSAVMMISDQTGATTARGIQFLATNVSNSVVWGSAIQYGSAANVVSIMDSTNARGISLTLSAAGNQTIASTAGTLVLTTPELGVATATSIAFGGGTALANYLEGTFTPTVTGPATVPVYSTNTGRYTRIGNKVHCTVLLTGDGGNEGSGAGQISIALPITANASQPAVRTIIGTAINSTFDFILTGTFTGGGTTVALSFFQTTALVAVFAGDSQNNATRTIALDFVYEV